MEQKFKQQKQLLNNPALLFRLLERAAFAEQDRNFILPA
jgi:hypothetical protein